jgi:hypothetical protein
LAGAAGGCERHPLSAARPSRPNSKTIGPAQRNHLSGIAGTAEQALQVRRPNRQGLPCFSLETVLLVDPDYASAAAADVSQDSLDRFKPTAKPLHAGRHGAPQVVAAPVGDAAWASSRALQSPAEQLAAVQRQKPARSP